MSRIHAHINSAVSIINQYKGEMPLSLFIKNFFSKEKKFGSRDRRTISSLCFSFFRIGHGLKDSSIQERMLAGLFLTSTQSNEILESKKPKWNEVVTMPLGDKLKVVNLDLQTIFPWNKELSPGVDISIFNASFLIQPSVYLRVRPGKLEVIKKKLDNAKVPFDEISATCLAFENGIKLEAVIDINKEAIIQDFSSQRVGEMLPIKDLEMSATIWDCCAASGGKSIMSYDLVPNINLTVSDVRQSIIQNLHDRFKQAGIKNYEYFVADLTNPQSLRSSLKNQSFDLVICDAPCSGCGTWSRTPEQLLFFRNNEIARYSNLQKSISSTVIPYVKKGGHFLYITCSAFKKENEEVVEFIQSHTPLTLVKMELFTGYNVKADTMFAALFKLN